jgi:hypothetical protein
MTASINLLTNCLNNIDKTFSFIHNATEASKFSEVELLGLLKWSLPVTWKAKFDLDDYIPMLQYKTKLSEACEAIK